MYLCHMNGILGLALVLTLVASQMPAISGHDKVDIKRPLPQNQGFMLPLRQVQSSGWRRHLLRHGSFPVLGAVRELGYFYATLQLGTPARSYSLIIDTGSTITYVPCKGCQDCGAHQSERFDPEASTSARRLLCTDSLCNCGSPSCTCAANNQCYYRRSYAEGSNSEGFMISDVLTFTDNQPPVGLVFGCVNGEGGELHNQMADGLVGMGNNNDALQSQLVARGIIEDVFSLCFGYPKDGIMLLGDVPLPNTAPTVYTPLVSSMHLHFYNIKMEGIAVDGQVLPLDASSFDRGYGTVLDSGTTFTYLPTVAFEAMAKAVGDFAEARGLHRTPGADPQYNDLCWGSAPDGFEGMDQFFPHAEYHFLGGTVLSLPPKRYLFWSKPNEYCLSFFDNGFSGTLLGSGSVLDVIVTYDRRNQRVGLTDMKCADLTAALANGTNSENSGSVEDSPPPAPRTSPPPPLAPLPSLPTTNSPSRSPEPQATPNGIRSPRPHSRPPPRARKPGNRMAAAARWQ